MTRPSQLTDQMVAQIKAMKMRGDQNQHIASWFGINQGRISEICGKSAKPQYRGVAPETSDIPPPGPYDFGGGGLAQVYRTIVLIRQDWDEGRLRQARMHFDRLYQKLGRPSETDFIDEIAVEIFYDERGVPKI